MLSVTINNVSGKNQGGPLKIKAMFNRLIVIVAISIGVVPSYL